MADARAGGGEDAQLEPMVDRLPSGRLPVRAPMPGDRVVLEPLDPERHGPGLFESARPETIWTHMPHGPFADREPFMAWLGGYCARPEQPFFAVVDRVAQVPRGMASYLNVVPTMGSIEVGYIWYAPGAQRSALSTEAMYLMFGHAFDDLGYRRLEWKCDSRNQRSMQAARRLGFTYEGTFRQHMIVKGRNRDTAWFALLDHEWPTVRANLERWLAPANFDDQGRQRRSLGALARPV